MSQQKKWKVGEGIYRHAIRDGTPGEKAIYMYLRLRAAEGKGPATRLEIEDDLGFSEKTIKTSFRQLIKKGIIIESSKEAN